MGPPIPGSTDVSDDDAPGTAAGKKQPRSAKACDRCRKSKIKCEPAPAEGEPCKSCAQTKGAVCTYSAPTFRRGPPKGYIQALEHRLHQVESVLAAIMSSEDPRAQSVIDDLHKDDLASQILDGVDSGPFGKSGRMQRSIDPTKDNFFASLVVDQQSNKPKVMSHRSRRQSRATRETVIEAVIARDTAALTRPTLNWQDRLSESLLHSAQHPIEDSDAPSSSAGPSRGTPGVVPAEPPRQKRRLNASLSTTDTPAPNDGASSSQSVKDEDPDDLRDCADAFGNLSIDENREVRYHGNASGLHLLVQAERTDRRNTGGVWDFPMAKYWPGPGPTSRIDFGEARTKARQVHIEKPSFDVQDRLIAVYFTYVNPAYPVVDEESFMSQYNAIKYPHAYFDDLAQTARVDGTLKPERPQKVSDLLLFAMFAYAASYLDKLYGESTAELYTANARDLLDMSYQESRTSTVQALILLGVREFGIGNLEEGWLHIGMAIRMALDLGLNRNPDKWQHNGRALFTEKEKNVRKQIWWACCLADKFSALFLGRTISIHEGDFSTALLEIPEDDADGVWRPCPLDPKYNSVSPVPSVYVAYCHHMSSLLIITGEVLAKVYRVSRAQATPSRALRAQLDKRLANWTSDLPEHLAYTPTGGRPCPAPHILIMHIQYWATVLLLHRPFIPKGTELSQAASSPSIHTDPVPWESFDRCQSAAAQIAAYGVQYHETYDLRWGPPFIINCFQAAGIVEIITLRYKPKDAQASIGLHKLIVALGGMRPTWTSAIRVQELIMNAQVQLDEALSPQTRAEVRQKRLASVAFDYEAVAEPRLPAAPAHPARPAPRQIPRSHVRQTYPAHWTSSRYHVRSGSMHAVAPAPAVPAQPLPFTEIMPGYDAWWPVAENFDISVPMAPVPQAAPAQMGVVPSVSAHPGLPSQEFTFTQEHFSTDFMQAMRDPVLHFPSAFTRY